MSIFDKLKERNQKAKEPSADHDDAPEVEAGVVGTPLDDLPRLVVEQIRRTRMSALYSKEGDGVVRNSAYQEEMARDASQEELANARSVLRIPEATSNLIDAELLSEDGATHAPEKIGESVTEFVLPKTPED